MIRIVGVLTVLDLEESDSEPDEIIHDLSSLDLSSLELGFSDGSFLKHESSDDSLFATDCAT